MASAGYEYLIELLSQPTCWDDLGDGSITGVVQRGEQLVVVGRDLAEPGKFPNNTAVLNPGDMAAYADGRVWRVKPPEEFSDPIRALLASRGLSQRLLQYCHADAGLGWTRVYNLNPGPGCDSERAGLPPVCLGNVTEAIGETEEYTTKGDPPLTTRREVYGISGGEAVVFFEIAQKAILEGRCLPHLPCRISSIFVRHKHDKDRVVRFLKAVLGYRTLTVKKHRVMRVVGRAFDFDPGSEQQFVFVPKLA